MSTVAASNLSTAIVKDLLRDGLRSAASGSDPLTDPKASSRPGDTKFVLTSFPDRDPFYPHVIVEEAGDTGARPDRREDLHEHVYDVRFTILSESSTDLFQIRDGVRDYIEDNITTFESNGYVDVEIASSGAATWEQDPAVESWELVISGIVYTT